MGYLDLVRKKTSYPKKKGRAFLYKGSLPMRILENGALDLHYVPPLSSLLKMEGKFVVELAKTKAEPLENFESEETRQAIIKAREEGLEAIRRLIKKRRKMEP